LETKKGWGKVISYLQCCLTLWRICWPLLLSVRKLMVNWMSGSPLSWWRTVYPPIHRRKNHFYGTWLEKGKKSKINIINIRAFIRSLYGISGVVLFLLKITLQNETGMGAKKYVFIMRRGHKTLFLPVSVC
jgi:hypothetical protein